MSFGVVGDDDFMDYKGMDKSTDVQLLRLFLALAGIGFYLVSRYLI